MKLQRIYCAPRDQRGTAYYIITTPDEQTADRVTAELKRLGWAREICSDGLEDHEVGLFVLSGINGQEYELRQDWRTIKHRIKWGLDTND